MLSIWAKVFYGIAPAPSHFLCVVTAINMFQLYFAYNILCVLSVLSLGRSARRESFGMGRGSAARTADVVCACSLAFRITGPRFLPSQLNSPLLSSYISHFHSPTSCHSFLCRIVLAAARHPQLRRPCQSRPRRSWCSVYVLETCSRGLYSGI